MKLLPTGTCFDDAAEFILAESQKDKTPILEGKMLIVHGICFAANIGMYAHAWIEFDGQCFDAKMVDGEKVFVEYEIDRFYRMFDVKKRTKYTIDEFLKQTRIFNITGPFEDSYKMLCKQKDNEIY